MDLLLWMNMNTTAVSYSVFQNCNRIEHAVLLDKPTIAAAFENTTALLMQRPGQSKTKCSTKEQKKQTQADKEPNINRYHDFPFLLKCL
jgi:hypothetical protein